MSGFPLDSDDKEKYLGLRDIYNALKEIVSVESKIKETQSNPLENAVNSMFIAYKRLHASTNAGPASTIPFDKYLEGKRGELNGQIKSIKTIYDGLFKDISALIEEMRPEIPGAEHVCVPCDMKSVFYVKDELPKGRRYECALCGRNNLDDNYRYDKKD